MGWKDLLQKEDEAVILPWTGGRALRHLERAWTIEGPLPREHGWCSFTLRGRKAAFKNPVESCLDIPDISFCGDVRGFLVGDRLVGDEIAFDADPAKLMGLSERVHLLEPGLDRFARVLAARLYPDGPLIWRTQEMPLGPEDEVVRAYEDRTDSIRGIKGVTPALEMAFRLECWQRAGAERRRAEMERLRLEEEERQRKEQLRREIVEKLGDGAGRRQMAQLDFAEAAKAALAVGGAEYLSHRAARARHEMIVRFRFDRRRFECTCDDRTLRIIDAGICLVDHETGIKGDDQYTLESLPGVIRQAIRDGVLVVFRHVD